MQRAFSEKSPKIRKEFLQLSQIRKSFLGFETGKIQENI